MDTRLIQRLYENYIHKTKARKRRKEAIKKGILRKLVEVTNIIGEPKCDKVVENVERTYFLFKTNNLELECGSYELDNGEKNYWFVKSKTCKDNDYYHIKNGSFIRYNGELVFNTCIHYGDDWLDRIHARIRIYKPGEWEEILGTIHKSEEVKSYLQKRIDEKERKRQEFIEHKLSLWDNKNQQIRGDFSL